jgi:uncharacterized protein YbgA (DUF1722 family)/uncharacterized protein YbbK (DUF523 family)
MKKDTSQAEKSTISGASAWRKWHDETEAIRIGISSCLLGQKVRFDGGHKRDRYLTDVLGRWMTWVPICPELEIGLGIPRPTIRLEGSAQAVHLIEPKSGRDLTREMETYAEARVKELQDQDLDGYVLKRGSPSCGMERVRVYGKGGMPMRNGVGVFARILMERLPHLPVEEEGRLNDPLLRERFISHVFCRHRWRSLIRQGANRKRLVEFHTAHKLLLLSHNEAAYRRLGRIVASAGTLPDDELFLNYEKEMTVALSARPNAKRHSNVLYHALGYLKNQLESSEKQELVQVIEDYRQELAPLIVPITLLRHHVKKHHISYLLGQLYLEPHPRELMLRNRI